jgi:alkyl hydroperoxide reductase subunit F
MKKIYDSIIIGGGIAGLTCGLYLARKKADILIITEDIGGQSALAGNVENFPGYKSISGHDLMANIQDQVESLDTSIVYEKIKSIKKNGDKFKVVTDTKRYDSKTIIIASGKQPRKLEVPGEKELTGRGVAYCATCDAPNFKNMPVAVVGGGNSSMDSILQLSKYTKEIYLIDMHREVTADAIMYEKVQKLGIVKFLYNKKTIAINGDKIVSGIEIEDIKSKNREELKTTGVFITIGWYPSTQFEMPVKLNKQGEIIIDKNCETNVKGIFAAGDVTDIQVKQMIVAAGEGAKAALSVYDYLTKTF